MSVKSIARGKEGGLFLSVFVSFIKVRLLFVSILKVATKQDKFIKTIQYRSLHHPIHRTAKGTWLREMPFIGEFWIVKVHQVVVAVLDKADILLRL